METVEFVSAIVSLTVAGSLIIWGCFLANAIRVAEAHVHRRRHANGNRPRATPATGTHPPLGRPHH